MNPFTVDWPRPVEIELARIWLQASDPAAVVTAQADIDRLLERNPLGAGQHLAEGLYRLAVPPLTVTYSVDTSRRFVEVSSVRYTP